MKKVYLLILIIGLSSCATLSYKDRGCVVINSKPENVTVDKLVVSRGKKQLASLDNVTFPYTLPNAFGKYFTPTQIKAYKDGDSASVVIDKKFCRPWLFAIDMFPIIYFGITDLATGCAAEPAQKDYTMSFMNKTASLPTLANATNPIETPKQPRVLSDVDKNIPTTNRKLENTFVLIIANENYDFVDDVDFALNDGNTFKEYCIKTLGVPEKQVWLYENASYGVINAGISKMVQAMDFFDNPSAIIYYCGHGIPDEKTGDAYIIPTDGNGKNMATCYSLNKLYTTFANTKAEKVTYFMDACFTGASKEGSMLVAARGVAREPKKETLSGKSVVFSATSADETAMAYKEKQHGLFTYFLLKKLQETQGNVSYAELQEYINKNVKKESFLTNEKPQTPIVATSPAVQDSWKGMTLK